VFFELQAKMKASTALSLSLWLTATIAIPHEKRQSGSLLDLLGGNSNLAVLADSVMSMSNAFMDILATKPNKVTDIVGEKDTFPGAKHKRYWFGPYDVPAGKVVTHNIFNMCGAFSDQFQGDMDQMESHTHEDSNSWKALIPAELRRMLSMMTFFTNKMDANSFLVSGLLSGFCRNCTILRNKILLMDVDGQPLGIDKGIYQHHVNMLPTTRRIDGSEPSFASVCPEQDKSFYPVGGYDRPVGMDMIGHVFATQAVEVCI
jgi:hypothetical protein